METKKTRITAFENRTNRMDSIGKNEPEKSSLRSFYRVFFA